MENRYKTSFIIILILIIIFKIMVIQKIPLNDDMQIDAAMGNLETVEDYDRLYEDNDGNGHFYYIMYIYNNHKLCDSTRGQTYHPPIHYIISAVWLMAMDFTPLDSMQKIESLQYLGLLYFLVSLFLVYKIMKEINLSDKVKLIVIIVFSFFPKFTNLALTVSNDYLLFIFSLLSLLYMIKWLKDSSIKNTLLLSIFTGMGSLVKANMIVMIFSAGVSFLMKLAERKEKFSKLFIEAIIFLTIFFGLTSLHYIRCLVEFGEYRVAVPLDDLRIENYSFLERWGIIVSDFVRITDPLNKNIWWHFVESMLYMKSKFYGISFDYSIFPIFSFISFVLVCYSFYYIIKNLNSKNKEIQIIMVTLGIQILAYIAYNIGFPYYCTTDSRYIPIALFIRNIIICSRSRTNE